MPNNAGSAASVALNTGQTFQTIQGIGLEFGHYENIPLAQTGVSMVRIDIGVDINQD